MALSGRQSACKHTSHVLRTASIQSLLYRLVATTLPVRMMTYVGLGTVPETFYKSLYWHDFFFLPMTSARSSMGWRLGVCHLASCWGSRVIP